jgi:hypothetical protein
MTCKEIKRDKKERKRKIINEKERNTFLKKRKRGTKEREE